MEGWREKGCRTDQTIEWKKQSQINLKRDLKTQFWWRCRGVEAGGEGRMDGILTSLRRGSWWRKLLILFPATTSQKAFHLSGSHALCRGQVPFFPIRHTRIEKENNILFILLTCQEKRFPICSQYVSIFPGVTSFISIGWISPLSNEVKSNLLEIDFWSLKQIHIYQHMF